MFIGISKLDADHKKTDRGDVFIATNHIVKVDKNEQRFGDEDCKLVVYLSDGSTEVVVGKETYDFHALLTKQ